MKTILMASGIVLLAVGCGTTQTGNRSQVTQEGTSAYSEARVEGQRAREAGLNEDRWIVQRQALAAEPEIAAPQEKAQGGAPTTGQGATVTTGTAGLEILDQAEIDLRKEELVVGKKQVSNGGVLIRTVVQTEEVSQPIELLREEYVIERIAAGSSRDVQARAENAFQGREIYIPLMREEPVAGKRTLLTESVKVGKRIEVDHQTITMPVRSEDVQIVKNPDLSEPRFSTVPRRSTAIDGKSVEPAPRPAMETSADTLKLAKEELVVGKRDVDAGGVFLQKVIHTENASQPIELRREEFAIERAPLAGQLDSADFSQRQIKLNLTREEAVAGTRNYVAETVRVRKQLQTDKQVVSGSVRKEAVEIVKLSDQPVNGQGGTGISSQSGVTLTTESGVAEPRGEKK